MATLYPCRGHSNFPRNSFSKYHLSGFAAHKNSHLKGMVLKKDISHYLLQSQMASIDRIINTHVKSVDYYI